MRQVVLAILIFPLNVLFFQLKQPELHTDPTVVNVFNEKEISSLERIVDVFDDFIVGNVGEVNNIQKAYNQYFDSVSNEEVFRHLSEQLKLSDSDIIQSLISQLKDDGIFDEIWSYNDYHHYHIDTKQGTKVLGLKINKNGKYFKMLNSLSKHNDLYESYYKSIMGSGRISPGSISIFLNAFHQVDFSREVNRLIFAIHYITVASRI